MCPFYVKRYVGCNPKIPLTQLNNCPILSEVVADPGRDAFRDRVCREGFVVRWGFVIRGIVGGFMQTRMGYDTVPVTC